MPPTQPTPENQQYVVSELKPEMFSAVAGVVTALGAQIELVQLPNTSLNRPQAANLEQAVNLEDFYSFADSSAKTTTEGRNNPRKAQAIWQRSQVLVAAREAGKKGIVVTVLDRYMGRPRPTPLPHTTFFDFLKSEPPTDDMTTADSYLNWSLGLDDLAVTSLLKQRQLIQASSRGGIQPMGPGFRNVRLQFLFDFIDHVTTKT